VDPRSAAEASRSVQAAPEGAGPLRRRLARIAEPLARAQREFNDAILKVADRLSERVDAAAARADAAERRAAELEERLLRLERRGPAAAPATVAAQPRADALPDYFAYESRMRAPADEVRERQRMYVDVLRGHAPVLDVGCGRGELLGLLRDAGVEARGVDANADMVAFARGEGLDVEQADLLEALGGATGLGAVTALQVVEHLPPAALVRFLELAHAALEPGGLLVVETINPATPAALRHYFADLTHAQPLVAETLQLLVQHAGFHDVEIRWLNAPPPHDDPRISDQLFAPLDYAIVGVA
jgi:2-polyprenyl-3-methyl-5-hydroxy-6-metoxy-1,4-benzoquinol methylase